jgi:hypothetical protein
MRLHWAPFTHYLLSFAHVLPLDSKASIHHGVIAMGNDVRVDVLRSWRAVIENVFRERQHLRRPAEDPHRMTEIPYRFRWEQAFRAAQIAKGDNGTSTVAIGFALATYASIDGSDVHPSYERVAAGLGVSARTVSRAAQRLVAEEWLAVTRERRPPHHPVTRYRLNIPSKWEANQTTESGKATAAADRTDRAATSTRQHRPITRTMTRSGTPTGGTNAKNHHTAVSPAEEIRGSNGELPPSFWDDDEPKPPKVATWRKPTPEHHGEACRAGENEKSWEKSQLDQIEGAYRKGNKLNPKAEDYLRSRRPHLFPPESHT